MKARFFSIAVPAILFAVSSGFAAVLHVNASSTSPVPPNTNWATAAAMIQDAVDAGSTLGRTVWVTNGVYRRGGVALFGTMTNRVALTNGVRLQSVNGPSYTTIEGSPSPLGGHGDGAVRCIYVDPLSVVSGFTITNGHTQASVAVNPAGRLVELFPREFDSAMTGFQQGEQVAAAGPGAQAGGPVGRGVSREVQSVLQRAISWSTPGPWP